MSEESNNNNNNPAIDSPAEFRKKQQQIEWRRSKVLEYLAQGMTQAAIAEKLQMSTFTISNDVAVLRQQSKERIRTHLEERLPFAFEMCLATFETNKRRAYEILEKTEDPRIKLQAISIINDSTMKIMDLETHSGTIETAMSYTERINKRLDSIAEDAAKVEESEEKKEEEGEGKERDTQIV